MEFELVSEDSVPALELRIAELERGIERWLFLVAGARQELKYLKGRVGAPDGRRPYCEG